MAFRAQRPWLTTAEVEVLDRSNRSIDCRTGVLRVHIDLDGGVQPSESQD
jgi:hypothetical protein